MRKTLEQEFSVRYSFPIVFTSNVFQPTNSCLAGILATAGPRTHRVLAVVDSGLLEGMPDIRQRIEHYAGHHGETMQLVARPVMVPGGERCKNGPAAVMHIHELIAKHHLCRQSFVLAIGGGAVLDMVGYATATAHRGLRLIRMPTTVLAQNDAGVGVKNGINAFGRKNFLGAFAPPFAVVNDFDFLDTLPARDQRAGLVEAVKVALIKDTAFFNFLCRERFRLAAFERSRMEKTIIRCAELHIDHIGRQGDPFEFGSSRPLDFGHWSAHKLEEVTGGAVRHGEAVAIGIALDSLYSHALGMIRKKELARILTLLKDLGLALFHPALRTMDVAGALNEFQEHLGGDLHITLLTGLGQKKEVATIDLDLMRHCIDQLDEMTVNQRPPWPRSDLVYEQSGGRLPAGLGTGALLSAGGAAMGMRRR
jgi:3-dehydroquinate synthase